jgi:hypothetical protein
MANSRPQADASVALPPQDWAALVWGYSVLELPIDGWAAEATLPLAIISPLTPATTTTWSPIAPDHMVVPGVGSFGVLGG